MIDHRLETVFALSAAPRRAPRLRGGRPINTATFYRWASRGCRGVRLETIQIGGTKCTSQEALQRFFDRLSNPERDASCKEGDSARSPSDPRRRREAEAIERELDRLGM